MSIIFTTEDGTARGTEKDYKIMLQSLRHFLQYHIAGLDYATVSTNRTITGNAVLSISIPVLDDDLFESQETFYGQLSATDSLPTNIHLKPDRAVATITDNKGM